MRTQGSGKIIMNSSVLGIISMQYRGAYKILKYAVEGLADTLRQELYGTGIYISLIEPGPIKSSFRKKAYSAYLKTNRG
jgi:short-subunit dehydrogenase